MTSSRKSKPKSKPTVRRRFSDEFKQEALALAERLGPLDVFDLRPLGPFTAQGLRHALLIVGFVAIFALFLFEWGYVALVATVAVGTTVFAAIGLILPVRGAHRRIREAKESELAACRDALRRARRDPVVDDDARLARVVFGAADPKAGALGSLYNLGSDPRLNHEVEVVPGVRSERASRLLSRFFADLRAD